MKNILIVVDMQNDFISGALGSDDAGKIVTKVAERIKRAYLQGEDVIFTLDTHYEDYLDTHEGKMLPVKHCIRGTAGWELAPEIAAARACGISTTFEKSTFGSVSLVKALTDKARDGKVPSGTGMRMELCGLCTDICVVSNALLLRAALPEAEICVESGLCAGVTVQKHEAALETMRSCQIEVS